MGGEKKASELGIDYIELNFSLKKKSKLESDFPSGGDVAQLVELQTGVPLMQVRFPGAARDFSPGVNF